MLKLDFEYRGYIGNAYIRMLYANAPSPDKDSLTTKKINERHITY